MRCLLFCLAVAIPMLGMGGCARKTSVLVTKHFSKPAPVIPIFPVQLPDGQAGFINKDGKVVARTPVPAKKQYYAAWEASEGIGIMSRGSMTSDPTDPNFGRIYSAIDSLGRTVIPRSYRLNACSEGLIGVADEAFSWGFVDRSGKIIVPVGSFHAVRGFHEGLTGAEGEKGLWGFVDKKGEWTIKPQFHTVQDFSEGLAAVFVMDDIGSENQQRILSDFWGRWGYITRTGAWAIRPSIDADTFGYVPSKDGSRTSLAAGSFSEGLAAVYRSGEWVYINRQGTTVIPRPFATAENAPTHLEAACRFREGLAAVKVSRKWGFINKKGDWVIKPQFLANPEGTEFSEGLAAVAPVGSTIEQGYLSGHCWGYINKKGAWVFKPQYEDAAAFHDGLAYVDNWSYIDHNGKWVWKSK